MTRRAVAALVYSLAAGVVAVAAAYVAGLVAVLIAGDDSRWTWAVQLVAAAAVSIAAGVAYTPPPGEQRGGDH